MTAVGRQVGTVQVVAEIPNGAIAAEVSQGAVAVVNKGEGVATAGGGGGAGGYWIEGTSLGGESRRGSRSTPSRRIRLGQLYMPPHVPSEPTPSGAEHGQRPAGQAAGHGGRYRLLCHSLIGLLPTQWDSNTDILCHPQLSVRPSVRPSVRLSLTLSLFLCQALSTPSSPLPHQM